MFGLVRKLIKLAILIVVIALIFNFQYKGKPARQYAREYGLKYGEQLAQYIYHQVKGIINKDMGEEIEKIKSSDGNSPVVQTDTAVSHQDAPPPKKDGITDQDRETLKKLLEQKSK
jgi:hypothetical protein